MTAVSAITNLEVDLLRTFVTIAETRSFTRAAERLHRTQSTVSLQLKRLEELLGRQLLERSARHVGLTDEGDVLLGFARQMLEINDRAVARLTEPELAGLVRLGTPKDFATVHPPEVLASFARAHPRVVLEVRCDFILESPARVRSGRVRPRPGQAPATGCR
jgi:DNA-binding transcriptional LysR family regulator